MDNTCKRATARMESARRRPQWVIQGRINHMQVVLSAISGFTAFFRRVYPPCVLSSFSYEVKLSSKAPPVTTPVASSTGLVVGGGLILDSKFGITFGIGPSRPFLRLVSPISVFPYLTRGGKAKGD